MPAALAIDWSPIRDAAIGGVPFAQLAAQYGIEEMTIRQRAHRHKWPVPAHVRTLAAKHGVMVGVSKSVKEAKKAGENATEDLALTLLQNGEQGSLQASNLLFGLLKNANLKKLQPLDNAGDVVTSLKGIRLAAGMDKQATNVSVQLGSFFRPAASESEGSGCLVVDVD